MNKNLNAKFPLFFHRDFSLKQPDVLVISLSSSVFFPLKFGCFSLIFSHVMFRPIWWFSNVLVCLLRLLTMTYDSWRQEKSQTPCRLNMRWTWDEWLRQFAQYLHQLKMTIKDHWVENNKYFNLDIFLISTSHRRVNLTYLAEY